ncbi:MAG: hypothetical protein RL215_2860 [Planctomycetota bacterium]
MSVKNPEKRRVLAASELSKTQGNVFESTLSSTDRNVRRTAGGRTDILSVWNPAKCRRDFAFRGVWASTDGNVRRAVGA